MPNGNRAIPKKIKINISFIKDMVLATEVTIIALAKSQSRAPI